MAGRWNVARVATGSLAPGRVWTADNSVGSRKTEVFDVVHLPAGGLDERRVDAGRPSPPARIVLATGAGRSVAPVTTCAARDQPGVANGSAPDFATGMAVGDQGTAAATVARDRIRVAPAPAAGGPNPALALEVAGRPADGEGIRARRLAGTVGLATIVAGSSVANAVAVAGVASVTCSAAAADAAVA